MHHRDSQEHSVAHRATRLFKARFGQDPEALFQAPGRVNLIGEHTDYNGGFVLPAAIDMGTVVAVRPAADGCFRAVAEAYPDLEGQWSCGAEGSSLPQDGWLRFLKGYTAALAEDGHSAPGLDLAVAGNVPLGAGLSSSASLTVAFGTALAGTEGSELNPLDVPHLARRAENDYVGCACGIMDQLISAKAVMDHALLIDCRDLTHRAVPIPANLELLVIDSRVQRELVESQYNLRRQQCQRVADLLGVDALRDVSLDDLKNSRKNFTKVDFRRALHVITENKRTLEAAEALAQNDVNRLSQLMAQSHLSMRDDFEITVPAIDTLVEIVTAVVGDGGGVRMTGGGFGGCVVALVERNLKEDVLAAVAKEYPGRTGLEAKVHCCQPADGAGPLAFA